MTVAVGDAPDLPYATELAARLGLEHVVLRRTVAELVARLPALIRIIGSFDGMFLRNDIHSPYLDPAVVELATRLSGEELVLDRDGMRLGKAPLRTAFEAELGERHAYRRKDPIEIRSGATALGPHLASGLEARLAPETARILAEDRVRIRDAEHPALPKECPGCHARGRDGTYCTVCGAYPI